MKGSEKNRIDALVEWAQQNGAKLHPLVEVYHDDVTKFSLRVKPSATHGLDPGFVAVSCPLSTTISYLNALIDGPITLDLLPSTYDPEAAAFPPCFMASIPPHVIGRFFLINEYLKGADSFWAPYIATLPQPEHISSWMLPAFWPEDDLDFLEGTNAYVAVGEIQANVKREFKQARKVLKEDDFPNWQDYTRLLYNWAFSIFTSRSFRPSLMVSQSAQGQALRILPPGCEIDDFSILQPLFDIGNHSMTSKYSWKTDSDPPHSSCQLICEDAYRPGDQVYNNYGRKTNSELLLAYGFILPETEELHNDYVHMRKREQDAASSSSADKPKDFLISLRPFDHPSSMAGRSRPGVQSLSQLHRLSFFVHFEPSLIWDLAGALSTPEEDQALETPVAHAPGGSVGLTDLHPGLCELVERIKLMLSAKLRYDYQQLEETDIIEDDGEDGNNATAAQPKNRNQQLALEYRGQCKKVLLAAMQALDN
ncbi:hypothetical protein B0T25DRAFT_225720 [Lasiosphaeria hispida]|uniref:SET domain-containing protein n=1 Tax=Lasiosphaeria hispida TaxID=260671 RepID=A0AAJ0MBI3_9PEZI|nr:hypothetical protein B0T25DRAFT_225720 [Lasiosphaeria hispida]